jgi:hypothetical protein
MSAALWRLAHCRSGRELDHAIWRADQNWPTGVADVGSWQILLQNYFGRLSWQH